MSRHHDTSHLDHATAYIILRTARLLRFHLNSVLAQAGAGISPEQWFILFKLWNQPPLPQNALTDPVLHDEPNIARLVRSLEAQGYVMRVVDDDDKRQRLVSLTEAGRDFMESLFPHIIAARESIFDGITAAEIDLLVDVLHRLEANLG
jgi:DNA-binding MarR family transcriptional regulator